MKNPNAFPNFEPETNADTWDSGMSLRDYFAAKAMQILMNPSNLGVDGVAQQAYIMADAMLSVREESDD